MAKKVKFPLNMGNGIMVRTIEELKEHYNSEKVIEYFLNGKLITWLEDRRCDEEAKQVRKLFEMQDKNNAAAKLPKIFGIKINKQVDVKKIEIRREKLEKLRAITSDDEILNDVDYVAFSQEELGKLLNKNAKIIYLCGKSFSIPLNVKNVKYIGINKPIVTILCKDDSIINIENNGIVFENCDFSVITKARIEYYKTVNENMTCNKNNDEKIDLSNSDMIKVPERFSIPAEVKKIFYAIFDGKKTQIAYVNIDANFVTDRNGTIRLLSAGVVSVPQVIYVCSNESITMNCGDVLVLIGKKVNSFIGGFSNEELEIISIYVAAEAYYEYSTKCKNMQCSEFDIEQLAIKWFACNGKINNDEQLMSLMELKKRNANDSKL